MSTTPKIIFDFTNKVKLSPADERKLKKWLTLASQVFAPTLLNSKFIHSSWIKNVQVVRVSLLLCGAAKMKSINATHRQKDYVTDVLSFPSFDSLRVSKQKFDMVGEELFLGDLVICQQKVLSQAKEFEISYFDEFIHLLFHGLIHLSGYDHELSEKEEKIMTKWEEKLLDNFSQKKGAR